MQAGFCGKAVTQTRCKALDWFYPFSMSEDSDLESDGNHLDLESLKELLKQSFPRSSAEEVSLALDLAIDHAGEFASGKDVESRARIELSRLQGFG